MCGLAFLFAPCVAPEERQERMSRALDCLAHRGPDEAGILHGDGFTCGHRRLSIIDLSASHQPMTDSTSRFTFSFNGEVYNYRESRQTLLSRWAFSTGGDTEVLLAGLVLEGPPFWIGWKGCGLSRSGMDSSSGCCWAGTGWARSRCITACCPEDLPVLRNCQP